MKISHFFAVVVGTFLGFGAISVEADTPVRVQGVSIASRVFRIASLDLRQMGIEIKVEEDCGNSQALMALANGEIDLALLSRPITSEDRANHPEMPLNERKVGTQTLAILIPRSVWDSGVKALKRDQVLQLYEGRADSWKTFGGEDRTTKFFEPAHGQGIWEMFANWLYGDLRKAPAVPWQIVKDGAEAQNSVQFFSGAASVAALRWADGKEVMPLAIVDESGAVVEPTAVNVEAGKYPLSRPAYVVYADRPAGNRRKVLEFLASEKGRAAIANSDLLPVAEASAQ